MHKNIVSRRRIAHIAIVFCIIIWIFRTWLVTRLSFESLCNSTAINQTVAYVKQFSGCDKVDNGVPISHSEKKTVQRELKYTVIELLFKRKRICMTWLLYFFYDVFTTWPKKKSFVISNQQTRHTLLCASMLCIIVQRFFLIYIKILIQELDWNFKI